MFTRQKKNYRTFVYAALIVTICILMVVLLWPKDSPAEENVNVNTDVESNEDSTDKDTKVNAGENKNSVSSESDEQNADITDDDRSYYVVRRDGEQISVFFSDGKGNEVKLENTDILYELLPPDDQASFEEGIKVNSQEELAALLQDFES